MRERFMRAWAGGVCMSVHEGGVKEWGRVLCDGVMRVCVGVCVGVGDV